MMTTTTVRCSAARRECARLCACARPSVCLSSFFCFFSIFYLRQLSASGRASGARQRDTKQQVVVTARRRRRWELRRRRATRARSGRGGGGRDRPRCEIPPPSSATRYGCSPSPDTAAVILLLLLLLFYLAFRRAPFPLRPVARRDRSDRRGDRSAIFPSSPVPHPLIARHRRHGRCVVVANPSARAFVCFIILSRNPLPAHHRSVATATKTFPPPPPPPPPPRCDLHEPRLPQRNKRIITMALSNVSVLESSRYSEWATKRNGTK